MNDLQTSQDEISRNWDWHCTPARRREIAIIAGRAGKGVKRPRLPKSPK